MSSALFELEYLVSQFVDEYQRLPREFQAVVLKRIRQATYGKDQNPSIDAISRDIREARYSKGLACPRCGSIAVTRFGKYKPQSADGRERQRYRCKDCLRTFSDMTASPIAKTHYPEKWVHYFECMVKGMSLRKTANLLSIHVSTAFFWRHKILTAIRQVSLPALEGIVEADETYVLESLKGKNQVKKLGTRKPRKRGGVAQKRGISREQVCVLVAVDRDKRVLAQTAGRGRITHAEIAKVVEPVMGEVTCLCTDSATCFKTFSRKTGIEHEVVNVNQGERVKKGIFHIQNVNAYHRRFKEWFRRFNGVATKYLDNYLAWHRFIDINRKMANHPLKMAFVQEAYKVPVELTTFVFRPGLRGLLAG